MTKLRSRQYLMIVKDNLNAFLYQDTVKGREDGLLAGMTIAIKDNIAVKDWPLSAASKILEGYYSPYDATVVSRLKEAGATIVGKTNLDEFAMGSSTENSAYGVTRNPWDRSRVPGGSSGGSAAAVAAGLTQAALGSDTGGSVRQPAAFCGVTGLRPSYGSVSRYGLVALASSMDVIGPIARQAEDVEKIFAVISGKDKFDQTTIDYAYQSKKVKIDSLSIGLPRELWRLGIDDEVRSLAQNALKFFVDKGAVVTEVSLPSSVLALPAYYIILPAEASSNLARYDGIRYKAAVKTERERLLDRYLSTRERFGSEVKRRILLGTFVLSEGHYDQYYQRAIALRDAIAAEHQAVFRRVDVLLLPTTPTPAFELGSRIKDPVKMYYSDMLTVPSSLAGVPAISVPCGFTGSGLPVGFQLIGAFKQESVILDLAKQYQAETDWHLRESPDG